MRAKNGVALAVASTSTSELTVEPLAGEQMCTPNVDGALQAVELGHNHQRVRARCYGVRRSQDRCDAAGGDGVRVELFGGITEGVQVIVAVPLDCVDRRSGEDS
jgi:hypothetical protein